MVKEEPRTKTNFDQSFRYAMESSIEVEKHQKKALDDLSPLRVLNLFRRISSSDCELLGMNPRDGRPEMFIWQYIPAPRKVSIYP